MVDRSVVFWVCETLRKKTLNIFMNIAPAEWKANLKNYINRSQNIHIQALSMMIFVRILSFKRMLILVNALMKPCQKPDL